MGSGSGAVSVSASLSGLMSAVRTASSVPATETPDELAVAAASNDLATVGRLLGPRDVNAISFRGKDLPESVVCRPRECSLLDAAVGSGSVEMTKYLLEFHRARPTRETLRQSISNGNLELFKMMRERLPEEELRDRLDLMEVAAEFHQHGGLVWLLRGATVFERELLVVFALEHKLADMLLLVCEDGYRCWWYGIRAASPKWRASAEFEFVPAPEGLSADGGWLRSKNEEELVLSPLGCGDGGVWTVPDVVDRKSLKYVALPMGVTTIGQLAFGGCPCLALVWIPSSVKAIGVSAFSYCSGLTRLEIPSSVTMIGESAFWRCVGLMQLSIPSSVTTIGESAFRDCSGLTRLRIQANVTTIESPLFGVVQS
jgi:hypothetical protein